MKKRILVLTMLLAMAMQLLTGCGPAWIRAALTAEELGHQVTLFEKNGELGGQLHFAKYPQL